MNTDTREILNQQITAPELTWQPFLEQQQQEGEPTPPPAAAPAVAIPAAKSPSGQDIPAAPAKEAPTKVVVKQPGIIDVRKAMGLKEAPSKSLDRESKQIQKRNTTGQTIIPVPKIKVRGETEEPPEGEGDGKPSGEAKPAATAPEAKPAPAAATDQPKIKIGDKEMTPEEAAARIAELEKAAAPKKEPAAKEPAAEPEKKEPSPEERKADFERRRTEALTQAASVYKPTEEELDTILTGGPKALDMFANKLATVEMNTRQWVEDQLNPVLDTIFSKLDPVAKMHEQVAQYQSEAKFYEKHPDLKQHMTLVRRVRDALNSPKYRADFEKLSPEEQDADIAANVKATIAEFGITPAAAAATPGAAPAATAKPPAAAPIAPKAQPKPPVAQLTQSGAPKVENKQAGWVNKLLAAGK